MAIDKILVNALLEKLKATIQKLEEMNVSIDDILRNEDTRDLVDRRMQIAIEICIDIGAHLTAGLSLIRQEKVSEIFLLIGEKGIISKEIALKMAGAAGLRNIIVHEYTLIDYQLAYGNLPQKLNDLHQFGKEVLEFIEKNN